MDEELSLPRLQENLGKNRPGPRERNLQNQRGGALGHFKLRWKEIHRFVSNERFGWEEPVHGVQLHRGGRTFPHLRHRIHHSQNSKTKRLVDRNSSQERVNLIN